MIMLTLKNDSTVISYLNAGITNDDLTLLINSIGKVYLANEVNNRIHLADTNIGEIIGGTGNDELYGGAGRDVLRGGEGADLFSLVKNTIANQKDLIRDFNVAEGDRLDISKLLTNFDPLQDSINAFVKMSKSGANTVIYVDSDGTGTADKMHAAVVLEKTIITDSLQDLIDHHNLIVSST